MHIEGLCLYVFWHPTRSRYAFLICTLAEVSVNVFLLCTCAIFLRNMGVNLPLTLVFLCGCFAFLTQGTRQWQNNNYDNYDQSQTDFDDGYGYEDDYGYGGYYGPAGRCVGVTLCVVFCSFVSRGRHFSPASNLSQVALRRPWTKCKGASRQ